MPSTRNVRKALRFTRLHHLLAEGLEGNGPKSIRVDRLSGCSGEAGALLHAACDLAADTGTEAERMSSNHFNRLL